jgi:hypothetical protein
MTIPGSSSSPPLIMFSQQQLKKNLKYHAGSKYFPREVRRKVIEANLIYNITFIWVNLTSLINFDKKRRRTSCWRTKSNGTSGKNVKNIIWHSFSTLRAILNHCSIVHHIKLMGYRYFSSTPKGPQGYHKSRSREHLLDILISILSQSN